MCRSPPRAKAPQRRRRPAYLPAAARSCDRRADAGSAALTRRQDIRVCRRRGCRTSGKRPPGLGRVLSDGVVGLTPLRAGDVEPRFDEAPAIELKIGFPDFGICGCRCRRSPTPRVQLPKGCSLTHPSHAKENCLPGSGSRQSSSMRSRNETRRNPSGVASPGAATRMPPIVSSASCVARTSQSKLKIFRK